MALGPLVIMAVLTACGGGSQPTTKAPETAMGLSPALTEMLFFLLPPQRIAARSQACNYPPQALEKPIVTTYPMNYEALLSARPSVVFTEEGISSTESIYRMRELGMQVQVFSYRQVADVLGAMRQIARVMQADSSKIAPLQQRLDSLEREKKPAARPKVLVLISTEPMYAHGGETIMSDMLRLAAADNVLPASTRPYPEVSREYLLQLDPDVILGARFGQLDSTWFNHHPEMKVLKAYKTRAIYPLTDDLTTRPSPRIFLGIEEISTALRQYRLENDRSTSCSSHPPVVPVRPLMGAWCQGVAFGVQ